MWTQILNINKLKQDGRWKVELYSPISHRMQSPFKMVKIKEIVNVRKENIKTTQYPDEKFNYIGLENVTPVTGELIKFKPKSGKEIKSVSKIFHKGDILYGRLRPNLNKVYLAMEEYELTTGICSGEFHILEPQKNKVLPHYLRTVLTSDYIQNYVKFMQTGTALPRLNIKDLLEIEVPLPNLEEQQKLEIYIVNKIHKIIELRKELNVLPEQLISNVQKSLEVGNVEKIHKQ